MLFEDSKFKIYSSEDVNMMSALEIADLSLHVYEEKELTL